MRRIRPFAARRAVPRSALAFVNTAKAVIRSRVRTTRCPLRATRPAQRGTVEHGPPGARRGARAEGQRQTDAGCQPLCGGGGDSGAERGPTQLKYEPPVQHDIADVRCRDDEQSSSRFASAQEPADERQIREGRGRTPDAGVVVAAAGVLYLRGAGKESEAEVAERAAERDRHEAEKGCQQERPIEVCGDLHGVAAAPGTGR